MIQCRQCPLEARPGGQQRLVSLCLITLLVFATLTIVTLLAFNPIILLNIAQNTSGQRDFVLKPQADHFNATRIGELTGLVTLPRLKVELVVQGKRAIGWLVDFQKEQEQGLGDFGAGLPPHHHFIYPHRELGLKKGQTVSVELNDSSTMQFLQQLAQNQSGNPFEGSGEGLELAGTFTVMDVLDNPRGKLKAQQIATYVFLDINYALEQMARQSLPPSPLQRLLTSDSFNPAGIASEATINLPHRVQVYSNADTEAVLRTIQQQSQEIMVKVGFFAVEVRAPIGAQLGMLQYFGMFIGVMLQAIIVSLFLLSVLMLDSSLQMGVDRQRADLAILKVVGATRAHVASHVLTGALKQVFFANLIAYPLAYLAFEAIEFKLVELLGQQVEVGFTFSACLSGLLIGFLVPVVASASPIRSIIGTDLAESLGQSKPNYSDVKTEIYVQGQEFPWGKVWFGGIAAVYGLAVYYLLPKAIINVSLGLMISLFFIFLEGLLVGLVVLSYSFEFLLEEAVAKALLWWTTPTDYALTLKNLSSHRMQNRKTSLMYALAVSFIIMIAVGFDMQVSGAQKEYMELFCADLQFGGDYINPAFVRKILPLLPNVDSVTLVASGMDEFMRLKRGGARVMVSDKAKLFFLENVILGVSGPFLRRDDVSGREVLYTDARWPYNLYTYLDSEQGQGTAIISEYAANRMGILGTPNHEFLVNVYAGNQVRRVLLNYSSVLSKRKGLYYNYFAFPNSEIAVSLDTYMDLTGASIDEIPIFRAKFYVKDRSQVREMAKVIAQEIEREKELRLETDYVWDRLDTDESYAKIQKILNTIMTILLGLVLVLCFFSLLTTAHVNIHGQQKEIGVLLVLGYEKSRIMRVYIYEAFVLVVNGCFKGVAVGYVVAMLMSWQRELFSSVTVTLNLSEDHLLLILASALVSSLLATRRALANTLSKRVTDLLSNYG